MVGKIKDTFNMVGKIVPNVSLINTRDERIKLHDFIGEKPLVIILLRSKYCPFSRGQLRRIANDLHYFMDLNVELIPILQDNKKNTKKMEEQHVKNKFPIYYDVKREVGKVFKQEMNILKLGRMPATLIVDKDGIIKWAYYADSLEDIPSNDEILDIIKNLNNFTPVIT